MTAPPVKQGDPTPVVATRDVFIISDLHLGGKPGSDAIGDHGFRMMTNPAILESFIKMVTARSTRRTGAGVSSAELVINGDFIDFLAEEQDETGEPSWVPFIEDPARATEVFERIASRPGDGLVFDALADFLQAGGRLTVLLGNHDLELSLPPVRAAFERRIGLQSHHKYRFLYDGEAYIIGNALVEHGNRYDQFNTVNHDALRRRRSMMSRLQYEHLGRTPFHPPAGSRVVAEVMNPFKSKYAFVDLLKPEGAALFALILALEPEMRAKLGRLAALQGEAWHHRMSTPSVPRRKGDIASQTTSRVRPRGMASRRKGKPGVSTTDNGNDLRRVLADILPPDELEKAISKTGDISSGIWNGATSLLNLIRSGNNTMIEERLVQVRLAIRALTDPDSNFKSSYLPSDGDYFRAAKNLAVKSDGSNRFGFVVFGHTHFAKDVPLTEGESPPRYLNTGTWANLMRFPPEIFSESEYDSIEATRQFFEDTLNGRLERYLEFHPTYVQLTLEEESTVAHAALHHFDIGAPELH